MNAREEILARVRAQPSVVPLPVGRAYRRAGTLPPAERVALFRERVADYRAEVRSIADADVETMIASVLAEQGAGRVGVPHDLPAAWRPAAVELVDGEALDPRALDALDGVVTGCTLAIAETGTIVLDGMRTLTLVPDLHVCVVREGQIVELVPEAIAALVPLAAARRPLTFVSGPSATSDIELSRVEGVHGPRRLVVLIVGGAR